jgi:hypothetical protein
MYFHLFNAMTDALREIEARDNIGAAKNPDRRAAMGRRVLFGTTGQ